MSLESYNIKKFQMDDELLKVTKDCDQKTLAIWAADVAQRILPIFEKQFPGEDGPRKALEYLREWVKTGVTKMKEVRSASLNAHAAARMAPDKSAARFAARACGQAAATAHVKTHAMGASWYAIKAIRAATESEEEVAKELKWEKTHLLKLIKSKDLQNF